MKTTTPAVSAAAIALAWAAGPAAAQAVSTANASSTAAATSIDELIVTGTRLTGVRAQDSAAPIVVVDSGSLVRTGRTEISEALARLAPSFNTQPFGGDAGNLTLSARLRGLSPNQTLVLVDGKRRHPTANLAVVGGPFQGSATADLNFIPLSAVERIEVLTDGAAAQYGTDAIAGVINIILKKDAHGGELAATGGKYYAGDGKTGAVTGNIGLAPSADSYLNLTAETRYHDFSDRGRADQRLLNPSLIAANPSWIQIPGFPHLNPIFGDARYALTNFAANGGYRFGESLEAYGFATYGHKYAASHENYRLPNRIPSVWPQGFTPDLTSKEDDLSVTGGLRGKLPGDWNFDLSTTYGRDDVALNVTNSANLSLFADTGFTPTAFHNGDFIATQWTSNLDISRGFDVGLASPLTVAVGLEQRHESYEIRAGDAASRYKAGSQSYPGFALTDAGRHSRDNWAGYVDLAVKPVEQLQLEAAGRYEHFSDFGDTSIGKLTSRYDFSDAFALRGNVSSGFRAPTLAEEFYSATNVSPTTAVVQLPPNAAAARLLGIAPLKPEKSTNFSVGFVTRPLPNLTASLDLYQIELKNRIVGSGTIFGLLGGAVRSPAVTAAISANGNTLDPTVATTGISIFSNAVDTRTRGAELVLAYPTSLGDLGHIDWSLTGAYTDNKVTKVKAPPPQIAASGQSLLNLGARSALESSSPKYKIALGGLYTNGPWSLNLVGTVYGESSQLRDPGNGVFFNQKIGVTPIFDTELAYRTTNGIRVAIGANNLFNLHPNRVSDAYLAAEVASGSSAIDIYPTWSPFGFNGGYYYTRLSYDF
ncbi:MAG TPA: TonB-dependent receptor [Phenylobacterium sp.]|uniref:TonB-dependent receptor plug domain-containing protein n=1 Tax=Phenylobacterium sp. TaxID=1871053 RepID=UPI002B47BC0F|nr:TonB-dependent receptor [Phenylobacterium sp.]HKR88347.1 TonB-dependent receptor [Phenylobacterium sp.]